MRKAVCTSTLALLLPIYMSFGQKAPDSKEIFAAVTDRGSQYYYPALMLRYMAGDTTLNRDEYRHLYYGYVFSEDYTPLEHIHEADDIMMIFEKYPQPDSAKAREVLRLAGEVMRKDPFSPRNINFMTYAYGIVGEYDRERISADRLYRILETIESSGDGLSENTPWHVLWFSHVNDFLGARGITVMKRTVVSRTVEFVEPVERNSRVKGYYFDFGRVYKDNFRLN